MNFSSSDMELCESFLLHRKVFHHFASRMGMNRAGVHPLDQQFTKQKRNNGQRNEPVIIYHVSLQTFSSQIVLDASHACEVHFFVLRSAAATKQAKATVLGDRIGVKNRLVKTGSAIIRLNSFFSFQGRRNIIVMLGEGLMFLSNVRRMVSVRGMEAGKMIWKMTRNRGI